MRRTGHKLYATAAMILITGLLTGCGLSLSTGTVQTSDTYSLWEARLDHMPFLVHFPDGKLEAFDDDGRAWPDASQGLDDSSTRRVEVYVGGLPGAVSLCGGPSINAPRGGEANGANVVSVLCDRSRTVVSFSDRVRPRVVAATRSYIPHVRHLLLEGIWESVAQEPEPLHE